MRLYLLFYKLCVFLQPFGYVLLFYNEGLQYDIHGTMIIITDIHRYGAWSTKALTVYPAGI